MTQDILITPGSGEPQILFRGSGTNDTPIELNVLSSYQSATGSGTALVFEGQEGQLFAVTDNLSSGTIFSVGDITGLSMLSVDASGDVKLGEFANSVIVYPGLTLDDNVPSTTSNVLYNDGGDLMWNGVTVIQSGAAQAVDGSGTASYVARFTDTNTLGTGVIYDNGTNVGIGTASPGQKLHISNTGHTELQIDAGVDSNPGVRLTNDAQNWVMRLAGGSSDQFQIRQITGTPANRLVIDTSGKVGIGADSPTQKLDIRYPAGGGMALLKSTDTTDGLLFGDMAYSADNNLQGIKHAAMTGSSDYMILSGGTDTYISAKSGYNLFLRSGGNDTSSQIRLSSTEIVINDNSSNLDFRVESNNATHALFVDGVSDYVGIGTGAPATRLDVNGPVRINSSSSLPANISLLVGNVLNAGSSAIAQFGGFIRLQSGFTTHDASNSINAFATNYSTATGFRMWRSEGSGSQNIILAEDGGNVGIGTTSPSRIFHAKYSSTSNPNVALIESSDSTNNKSFLRFTDPSTSSITNEPHIGSAGDNLVINTSNLERMRIAAGGDVGIGTVSPSGKLHIYDNNSAGWEDTSFRIENPASSSNTYFDIAIGTSTGYNDNVWFKRNGNPVAGIYNNNSWFHYQNVSIRTDKQIVAESNGNAFIELLDGSNDMKIGYLSDLRFYSSYAEKMVLDVNGNLGIGTASPSEKLHIAGDVIIDGDGGTIAGTTWDNGLLRIGTSSGGISIDTNEIYASHDLYLGALDTASAIIFRHATTERMRVASGGNIGINTTSPQDKLHVNGGRIRIENVTDPKLSFNDGSANRSEIFYDTSEETFVLNHADADLNQLVLTSGNNVGVGTNSPNSTLHVYSAVSGDNVFNVEGTNGSLFGVTDNLSGVLMSVNTIAGLPVLEVNSDYSVTAGRFNQNDFVISSGGDIGIGTDNLNRGKVQIEEGITYASPYNYRDDNHLTLENSTSLEPVVQTFIGNLNGSNRYGNLLFYPASTQSASKFVFNANIQQANHFSILGDGKVGIGTASPSYKLDVNGTTRITPTTSGTTLILDRLSGQATIKGGSDGYVMIESNGTGNRYISLNHYGSENVNLVFGGGNVGIGTVSPSEKLHVMGGTRLQGDSTNTTWTNASPTLAIKRSSSAPYVSFHSDTGARIGYLLFTSSGTNVLNAQNYNDLEIRTNNTTRMTIDRDGAVGIGTTSPLGKLHIDSSIASNALRVDHNNSSYSATTINTDTYGLSVNTDSISSSAFCARFRANSGTENIMFVGADGNIGIGTESPEYKLDVVSNTNTSEYIRNYNPNTGSSAAAVLETRSQNVRSLFVAHSSSRTFTRYGISAANTADFISFGNSSTLSALLIGTGSDDTPIVFGNNDTERMRIAAGGNVGVGTDSPNAVLHAYGSTPSGTVFNVEGTNGSLFSVVDNLSGVLMSVNNNAGLPVFEVNDDDSIVAGRFAQNDFVVTTSGDIGMGTANPASKLEVNGTVTATCASLGQLNVDNLRLDGNTLSSTNTNGNINITPNGTGGIAGGTSATVTGNYSVVGGGISNTVSGNCSTISGGMFNTASGNSSTVSGGSAHTASGNYSTVSGGYQNCATGDFSTVSGGYLNRATNTYSKVGGGYNNCSGGDSSAVSGGYRNCACATNSSVSGGRQNFVNARHGSINGGHYNVIQSPTNECCSRGATIGGGVGHNTSGGTLDNTTGDLTGTVTCCDAGRFSTISGGLRNIATCGASTVSGGAINTASGYGSAIGGGGGNTASFTRSTVGGGGCNCATGFYSTISGGKENTSSGQYSTIGGGGSNFFGGNTASGDYSTVGGGGGVAAMGNSASGYGSTVSGGGSNTASGNRSTVGGGCSNTASGYRSTVGGGCGNTATSNYSTASGGYANTSSGYYSTASGGKSNTASGYGAVVSGGGGNTASASSSTVSGGYGGTASGAFSAVAGGQFAKASRWGEVAHAAGRFAANGDAQHSTLVARKTTTSAGTTYLALDGASQRINLTARDTAWAFDIKVIAVNSSEMESGSWHFRGGIHRDDDNEVGFTGSIIEESNITSVGKVGTVALEADDTNYALNINVTTTQTHTVRWVAVIDLVQVSFNSP